MEGSKNERVASDHIRRKLTGGMRRLDRFGIGHFDAHSSRRLEDLYDPRHLLISEFFKVVHYPAFNSATISGQTITFGGFSPGNGGLMLDTKGLMYGITSASMNITLSPQGVATTGNVTGSLNLVSSLTTLNGPFTGTYILRP